MQTGNYERFKAFYSTPSFWLGELAGIKQFPLSAFDFSHLNKDETPLELPVIPVNTVLGKRAEYFYQFCIEQSNNYDLVVANLQIQKEKRTLGELDDNFVYKFDRLVNHQLPLLYHDCTKYNIITTYQKNTPGK